jgi:dolichol-phosphate mannosyltransferase
LHVTLVLPAFNEARDLPALLERVDGALRGRTDYRVLVVDDGSTDGTAQAVLRLGERLPIQLLRHPRNLGLGAAVRTGLTHAAEGEGAVVTMDADNTQDPALIPGMVRRLEQGFDLVIASRFQPGGAEVGVPASRRFLSHTASAILRVLTPYPGVRDYTCGYRAYRAESLRGLIGVFGQGFVRETGFACMLELLLNFRALGARAMEVPLALRYDLKSGPSKIRVVRTVLRYAATVARGLLPLPWRVPRASRAGEPPL